MHSHKPKKKLLENDEVFAEKSPINGVGIFAKRDFECGETIGKLSGKVFKHRNKTYEDVNGNMDWIGLKRHTWIDPTFPFSHVNHSCNPNISIKGIKTVVAIRDIAKGEELTLDYAVTEEDARFAMPCTCGTQNCRGEIRSIHFIPLGIFRKYLPFIPNHFKKIYEQYHILR